MARKETEKGTEDVYNEEEREKMVEEDEVKPEEASFVEGFEDGGEGVKCAQCGEILGDDFIEIKVKGKVYSFCSKKCAEKFRKGEQD